MTRLRWQRTVDAPPDLVWDVITDHALYAEAAPNLSAVRVVDGAGTGMVRQCVDTDGNEWLEECTRWDEGEGFAVKVDVANSDFHRRLFSRFAGEWSLAASDDGVVVTVQFDFTPRYGPLGALISWSLARKAPPIVEAILDRWEEAIDARRVDDRPAADRPAPDINALYP